MAKKTYTENLKDAIRGHNYSYVYSSGSSAMEKKTSRDFNEKLHAYLRKAAGGSYEVVLSQKGPLIPLEERRLTAEAFAKFKANGFKDPVPTGTYSGYNQGVRAPSVGHTPALNDVQWTIRQYPAERANGQTKQVFKKVKYNRAFREARLAKGFNDGSIYPVSIGGVSNRSELPTTGLPLTYTTDTAHQFEGNRIHDMDIQFTYPAEMKLIYPQVDAQGVECKMTNVVVIGGGSLKGKHGALLSMIRSTSSGERAGFYEGTITPRLLGDKVVTYDLVNDSSVEKELFVTKHHIEDKGAGETIAHFKPTFDKDKE